MKILTELNTEQYQAVTAPLGSHLILAGAGSGKTRVLVHRIAWLLKEQGLDPYHLLAVTFTNKAAKEMTNRIESLVGTPAKGMWVGTFHSLTHRLLRQHWQQAKLNENFQVIDSDDQYRLVRRIMKSFNLDEKEWSPKKVQWFINQQKDDGLRANHVETNHKIDRKIMLDIYREYEKICEESSLVDFAELLLRAHEMLLNHPELLHHYQQRFQYVLIDEFQDTNAIQYAWLRLLIGEPEQGGGQFMAVGDDDQSIYAWRGAKIENIHAISQDYSNTHIIRLEQNYRSTATILHAANALIAKNTNRLGKKLWTEGEEGQPIAIYTAYNELDEARFVVHQIKASFAKGLALSEHAILYRSNAQSRALEEALLQERIAYRIHGGLRFFERAEIKDALAYLRLTLNPHDSSAFERVINTPTRGIGEQTLNKIRNKASDLQQSLWQACLNLLEENDFTTKVKASITDFMNLIQSFSEKSNTYRLDSLTELMLEQSGLIEYYKSNRTEQSQTKVENLEELISAAKQFNSDQSPEFILREFLSHTALEAGESQAEDFQDCVQLMTLHSAKGLEFPFVFICGLEENLFPHQLSIQNPAQLEEERRLCYVGMTRAMKQLLLTHCEIRRLRGKEQITKASRFLAEIPKHFLHSIRPSYRMPSSYTPPPIKVESGYSGERYDLGQRVLHAVFGEGTVIDLEYRTNDCRVQVRFDNEGTKWLMASIAKLAFV